MRLARAGSALTNAYQAVALAQVEDFEVLLRTAQGFGPAEVAPDYGALWLAVRGAVGWASVAGGGLNGPGYQDATGPGRRTAVPCRSSGT